MGRLAGMDITPSSTPLSAVKAGIIPAENVLPDLRTSLQLVRDELSCRLNPLMISKV